MAVTILGDLGGTSVGVTSLGTGIRCGNPKVVGSYHTRRPWEELGTMWLLEQQQITGLGGMWNVMNEVKQLEGELAKQLKINN